MSPCKSRVFIFLSMPVMAESPYIKKEVSLGYENAVLLPAYDKRGNTLINKYYEKDYQDHSGVSKFEYSF